MVYVQTESGSIIATENPEFWPEAKRLTSKAGRNALREQSLAALRNILQPGDTVHTVLRHVSRSGMRRRIDFCAIKNGEMIWLSGHIANVLDSVSRGSDPRAEGLIVDGCGMDMGYSVVYALGYAMWPKGTPEPHGTRNGKLDSDGGYALRHKWV